MVRVGSCTKTRSRINLKTVTNTFYRTVSCGEVLFVIEGQWPYRLLLRLYFS